MDYILGRENWEFCVQVATLVLSWDAHRLLATSTDPWSIGDIGILDNNQLANGPGISDYRHNGKQKL